MALTPKDSVLFDLYTSLAERISAGGRAICDLVTAPPGAERQAISARVGELETEADDLLRRISLRIDEMFITPYDRGDLQELADYLDDSMDAMEEAADLAILHSVQDFPKETAELADAVRRLAELTATTMPRLRTLKDLGHYYRETDTIEDEGDRIHRRITAKLFSGEYDAMTVLRIQGVVDALEQSLDEMSHACRVVRTIAIKES
ncbi:MAG: hypothetical protein RL745_883 [Actinomycetota bacterium]|jgi:predicted phosphate transport protein (TIGR00153 family)